MTTHHRQLSVWRESFVPVILVLLALFLMLGYSRFMASYESRQVLVIEIDRTPLMKSLDTDMREDLEGELMDLD